MKNWTRYLPILALLAALQLGGCGLLHDGNGWEHNMEDDSGSMLEHKH